MLERLFAVWGGVRRGAPRAPRAHRWRLRAWPLAFVAGVLVVAPWASSAAGAATPPQAAGKLCSSGQKINVGADASLSGTYSFFGQPGIWGTQAYIDYVNSIGGVYGCKFKLDVNNDQSTPSVAATNIRKEVVQNHDQFLLGPADSSDGAAAIPVINSLRTVDLVWGSGWYWTGTTKAQDTDWAFPGHFDVYHAENVIMNKEVIVPHHWTRVAVLMDTGASTDKVGADEKALAAQSHGAFKVVATQFLQPGQTDDTPQILNLLAAHPQVIIDGVAPGQDAVTALRALRAQTQTVAFGECAACNNPSFVAAVGGPSVMQNVYITGDDSQLAQVLPRTSANAHTINDINLYYKWMKKAGHGAIDQVNTADYSWQTMEMLVDAIKTAHSLNETDVRNALAHQHNTTMYVTWHRTPANYENYTVNFLPLDTVSSTGTFVPVKPVS
ncbi:MAG: ABC transporter substrate-binding protein [Acidimicrobiales bacterium]|nr:ABC transporter substrate-binding protein [Acidimicrobiales bacterium]